MGELVLFLIYLKGTFIDDMKIFQESCIMKHIRPNDLILADHGFTVQHLINHLQAEIKKFPHF